MYICKVVGKVVATIRNPLLGPYSLILLRRLSAEGGESGELLVAADPIGCGQGDTVLATQGSNARFALSENAAPIDLAVVGIVNSYAEEKPVQPRKGKKQLPTKSE